VTGRPISNRIASQYFITHQIMKKQLIAIFATLSISTLLNASPLSDLVQESKADWMMGTWKREGVTLSFDYKLDKHAIEMKYEIGEVKGQGMIAMTPGEEAPDYLAADDRGGVAKGKWDETDGNPTLKLKHTDADGNVKQLAVVYSKVDDQTMKVSIRQLNDAGETEGDPMEVELKKRIKEDKKDDKKEEAK
jgi:hypothetical protein